MIYHRNSQANNRRVYQACMAYEARKKAEKMSPLDDIDFAEMVSRCKVAQYQTVDPLNDVSEWKPVDAIASLEKQGYVDGGTIDA